MRIPQFFRSVLLLIGLLGGAAPAATPNQPAVGARAISMGGAFAAVAGDASAAYWNPAALASLQRQELTLTYADRFGLRYLHELKARPYPSVPADYGASWRRAWDDNDVSFNFQMTRGEFLQALEEKGGFVDG